MKFIADSMLGRLARWLRILGFDTIYFKDADKAGMVRAARRDGRILLTRNTRLAGRGVDVERLFIRSDHLHEQLEEVIASLDLSREARPFTRCSECNEPLQPIDKEAARGRVADFVYHQHQEFSLCPACDRIYWKGTHLDAMKKALERLA